MVRTAVVTGIVIETSIVVRTRIVDIAGVAGNVKTRVVIKIGVVVGIVVIGAGMVGSGTVVRSGIAWGLQSAGVHSGPPEASGLPGASALWLGPPWA